MTYTFILTLLTNITIHTIRGDSKVLNNYKKYNTYGSQVVRDVTL